MRQIRSLILLLLLTSLSFASIDFSLVIAGALISGVILGLAFSLAFATGNPSLEGWAKVELSETISAFLIIALVYGAVNSSNPILLSLTGKSNLKDVRDYILTKCDTYLESAKSDAKTTLRVAHRVSQISSFYYSITTGYAIYFSKMMAPFMGIGGLRSKLYSLMQGLSEVILVYETIKYLAVMLTSLSDILFSVGFALRLIPFTRKLGATLMAFGFAGAVVFPWVFFLSAEIRDKIEDYANNNAMPIHHQLTSEDLENFKLNLPGWVEDVCENQYIRWLLSITEFGWWLLICPAYCAITCAGFPGCFVPCVEPIVGWCFSITTHYYYLAQALAMRAGAMAGIYTTAQLKHQLSSGRMFDLVIKKLFFPVSRGIVLALAQSLFIAGTTILSIRALSEAFGGSVAVIGLSKLV